MEHENRKMNAYLQNDITVLRKDRRAAEEFTAEPGEFYVGDPNVKYGTGNYSGGT